MHCMNVFVLLFYSVKMLELLEHDALSELNLSGDPAYIWFCRYKPSKSFT